MDTKEFQKRSLVSIFFSYFKLHKKLFILDMSCAFLIAVIDLSFPAITRYSLYELLPVNAYKTFITIMVIMLIAYTLRAFFYYIITYYGHSFGVLVEADIRSDLFQHMQELSYGYFDKNRTGQLMSRLTADLFDITELAHHVPEDVFISTLTIIGSISILFTIQWKLTLVIALILPIFLLVVWYRRSEMSKASLEVKEKTASINVNIESGLSGMKTAKAFANENSEFDKFSESNDAFKTSKTKFYKAMGYFNATMEFFLCVLPATVILVGGILIMKGQMNQIDLITFTLYIVTFITPIRKLSNFAELFAKGGAGLVRFVDMMRTETEMKDDPNAIELGRIKGELDIENISFSYKKGIQVLHNISLHVNPGETIAVVGQSGGGKSTLCKLIPRFDDVNEGKILLDHVDIRNVTQESLHKNIGVVDQEIFLFADSILENIRYGRPDATPKEVAIAAKQAEIYDDILAMSDGFNTFVGERGAMLSGGQKQRISIARIFLKNPPFLILDEATSALDSVTEAKIQETFDSLIIGRTTFVIAHRLSTVRNADRILVFDNGNIIEDGNHEFLIEENGVYAELYKTQHISK
ncbi:MAG: ABC transporter ATP-binding protein/permease [Clostridiaceae bacterium]|nr:ABC transporter ATP-binding protein/permease [Clostridiaceae bacterium]